MAHKTHTRMQCVEMAFVGFRDIHTSANSTEVLFKHLRKSWKFRKSFHNTIAFFLLFEYSKQCKPCSENVVLHQSAIHCLWCEGCWVLMIRLCVLLLSYFRVNIVHDWNAFNDLINFTGNLYWEIKKKNCHKNILSAISPKIVKPMRRKPYRSYYFANSDSHLSNAYFVSSAKIALKKYLTHTPNYQVLGFTGKLMTKQRLGFYWNLIMVTWHVSILKTNHGVVKYKQTDILILTI